MSRLLIISACICVIALNLLATAKVMGDASLPDGRKMFMLVVVWMLPLIGAAVVMAMRPREG